MSVRNRNRLSRREILKVAALTSTGAALAACVPAGQAPAAEGQPSGGEAAKESAPAEAPAAAEGGEIKVLVCCYAPPDLEVRNKINDEFQQANPTIKINQELLPAGQNYFEKLQTLIAAGTPPDVFDMWEGYVQPYAENGALLSLDPLLATDPIVKKDDFVPVAIEGGSWKDNLYAFLIGFIPGPVSLYYNPDHFARAGIAEPRSDWKWDDMRTAARELAKNKKADGTPETWGLVFDLWFVPWLYWIWSNGGDVFNPEQTQCTLTDPRATDALQYWADLSLVDKSTIPSSELAAMQGSMNAFQTGLVSMYLGNSWDMGTLKTATDLNWKAVLSPKANDGNRVWYMHFQCWSISSKTKVVNAAWQYIRDWTMKYAVQVIEVFPQIPSLKQLLPKFDNETTRSVGWSELATLAMEPGILRVPGSGAKWDKISGLIQAELDLAFAGQKTAADAAATACPQVDEELQRVS